MTDTKQRTLPELPYQVSADVMQQAKQIKLALFDVDGVLTDGSLHYASAGEQVKVFNALDGHGLKMLNNAGIAVGVISARKSEALKRRLSDLKIEHCHLGVDDKLAVFEKLQSDLKLNDHHCAFTGDDVIDMPVMERCGLAFTVANGHFIVQEMSDWVAPLQGGAGAVRAICDVLLYAQDKYPLGLSGQ